MRVDKAALQLQTLRSSSFLVSSSTSLLQPQRQSNNTTRPRLEHPSSWQALRRSTRPRPELRSLQPMKSFLAWMVTQTRRRSLTSRTMTTMRFISELMMMLPRYEQLLPLSITCFFPSCHSHRWRCGKLGSKHHAFDFQQMELTSSPIGRKEQGSYFELHSSGSPPWYRAQGPRSEGDRQPRH